MDLKKGQGKAELAGGAEVAFFKAKLPLKVTVRIPWTEYSLGIGLTAEVSALSLGAEGGAGFAVNKDGKLFSTDGGLKIGAGLAGAGVKFGIDISK